MSFPDHKNEGLRQRAQDALRWDPAIDARSIWVTAEEGIVTLSGQVSSYRQKLVAEHVVASLHGVKAIAQDIEVRCLVSLRDDQIAERVRHSLKWDALVPPAGIEVKVRDGWVTLSGIVTWHFQRLAAEQAVERLYSVTGLTDEIVLDAGPLAANLPVRIEDALRRQARLDAGGIVVTARAGYVTLAGRVRSLRDRATAMRVAWSAPGVYEVEDRLLVE